MCSGAGASGSGGARFYRELGVPLETILGCDGHGVVHEGRGAAINRYKAQFARKTPARTLADALRGLAARGVKRATLTLHVGAGTFSPVKAEAVEDHVMHAEWGEIGAEAAEAIRGARSDGARVIAVGTTALRLIETAAAAGDIQPFMGETAIFITPGFRFRAVDMLITNFHLPCSTLFMLVCAFAGTERMKRAYAHALAAGYRFYSYGDCCLLHRGESG